MRDEVKKKITKMEFYSEEAFKDDYKRFVNALKQGRFMVNITSVSQSGLSRTMVFCELFKSSKVKEFRMLNFQNFFKANGYTLSPKGFRVTGCGMDMVFGTLYAVLNSKDSHLANNYHSM